MDKRKKSYTVQYIIIAVLSVVIILMLLYIFMRSQLNSYVSFAPDLAVTDNPLMGYAPNAANKKLCANTRMVYIPITWTEWEPEEGVFDIEGLERKYNISQWKEENKHAVIRFMCDVPDDNTHYDIPKWLLDKTGDGVYYDL